MSDIPPIIKEFRKEKRFRLSILSGSLKVVTMCSCICILLNNI